MQTSSFFHPLNITGPSFSGKLRHRRPATMANLKKDGSSGGKMVDENMIVLRERIRKMKVEMECGDHRLPENWMRWEKTYVYSGCYHSDVYEVVAFLQRFLVESRPAVAVGLVAVFVAGGSTVAVAVLHQLMKLAVGN